MSLSEIEPESTVANLMQGLDRERDQWREKVGFSPDILDSHNKVLRTSDPATARSELIAWLGRSQPCLFGRLAARHNAIATCILFDEDLRTKSDSWICDQIQAARTEWTRDAFYGGSSGFVIFLLSESLATAQPGIGLQRLAQRVCQLYLLRTDVQVDKIYHDEVFLEASNRDRTTWKWLAGINFFGSCADKRWWHDHRVPGGIALSVNSIGHFVKSRIAAEADKKHAEALQIPQLNEDIRKIDSLDAALEWAMRTIYGATNTDSGKATYLLNRNESSEALRQSLPAFLQGYEHRFYEGYYHTDFTLPSIYFQPDVKRPELTPTQLDLTYLTDSSVDNPDHLLMGKGRRIRESSKEVTESKRSMAEPVVMPVADSLRLTEALETAGGTHFGSH